MEKLLIMFMYFLGILWIVVGGFLVFATKFSRKKFFSKIMEKWDLKKYAAVPIIFGVLLLLASPYNRYRVLVIILGIIGILKGVIPIVSLEKAKKWVKWWLEANDNIYRVWGIIVIIIGSVVLMGI